MALKRTLSVIGRVRPELNGARVPEGFDIKFEGFRSPMIGEQMFSRTYHSTYLAVRFLEL